MTCTERVVAALWFDKTDFVPTKETHWGITVDRWLERRGMPPRAGILPFDNVHDPRMHWVDLVIVRAEDA